MRSFIICVHFALCALLFVTDGALAASSSNTNTNTNTNSNNRRNLSRSQRVAHFKEKFRIFDEIKNAEVQELTMVEIADALRTKGLTPSEEDLERILFAVDKDENGMLDRDEYERLMRITEAFGTYDRDMDGYLSVDEMTPAANKLGVTLPDEVIAGMLALWDVPSSDRISLAEFIEMMVIELEQQEEEEEELAAQLAAEEEEEYLEGFEDWMFEETDDEDENDDEDDKDSEKKDGGDAEIHKQKKKQQEEEVKQKDEQERKKKEEVKQKDEQERKKKEEDEEEENKRKKKEEHEEENKRKKEKKQ